jgi:hypothetical protein
MASQAASLEAPPYPVPGPAPGPASGPASGDEPHADPADVVALPHGDRASGAKESRDVLAGWEWTTGSLQTIDDNDSAAIHAARGDRRRLFYAIGGALGGLIVLAILAFAFGGSSPSDQRAQADKRPAGAPSETASSATAPSETAPAAPPAAPSEPPAPTDPAATTPGTAPAAPSEPAAPTASAPPAPAPSEPSSATAPPGTAPSGTAPPGTAPPGTAPPQPSSTAATAPAPAIAPSTATTPASRAELIEEKPGSGASDPSVGKAPSPRSPGRPEPDAAPPARVATEPPRPTPPKPEPSKVAAARAEPPRPEPARPEPPKPEPRPEIKKLEKKPEPKKPPERPVRRTPPPEKVAKAPPRAQQPIDPYAMPATTKPDPAEAYKTGLQQYARGDTSGALATFRSSLATSPRYAPTWRGLGLVFEKLGDKGQARSAFRRYLLLAPAAPDADQIRDRMERLGS